MPKSLFQEIIFTVMMVFVMVYAMVCYNIILATGGITPVIFLKALKELPLMVPVAFMFDTFIVGPLSKKITFSIFNPKETKPIFIILSISIFSILFMCPLMSFVATLLFNKGFNSAFMLNWALNMGRNYPMAFVWQLFVAGPLVRKVFSLIFKEKEEERV